MDEFYCNYRENGSIEHLANSKSYVYFTTRGDKIWGGHMYHGVETDLKLIKKISNSPLMAYNLINSLKSVTFFEHGEITKQFVKEALMWCLKNEKLLP